MEQPKPSSNMNPKPPPNQTLLLAVPLVRRALQNGLRFTVSADPASDLTFKDIVVATATGWFYVMKHKGLLRVEDVNTIPDQKRALDAELFQVLNASETAELAGDQETTRRHVHRFFALLQDADEWLICREVLEEPEASATNEPPAVFIDPLLPPEVTAALLTLHQWLKTQGQVCVLLCERQAYPPAHIRFILHFPDTE